jgi:hypothetical protein
MSFQQPKLANPLSPAFAGLKYDADAYHKQVMEAVGPGRYRLEPVGPNCGECMQTDATITMGTSGPGRCSDVSLVDVESDLKNVIRPLTYAPQGKYRGRGEPPTVCSLHPQVDCRTNDATANTRLVDPPCTLRGTGWNRWEWLCQDPQQRVLMPFDYNIDTALLTKDTHRPRLERPLDPTISLPPGSRVREPIDVPIAQPCYVEHPKFKRPALMMWRTCEEFDKVNGGFR